MKEESGKHISSMLDELTHLKDLKLNLYANRIGAAGGI